MFPIMKKIFTIMPLMLLFACSGGDGGKYETVLKATVLGDTRQFAIAPMHNNSHDYSKEDIVDVVDGKFEITLKGGQKVCYEVVPYDNVVSEGIYYSFELFPDSSVVEVTIRPIEEYTLSEVKGGELNRKMTAFRSGVNEKFTPVFEAFYAKMDSMRMAGNYYSPEMMAVYDKLDKASSKEESMPLYKERDDLCAAKKDLTPEARVVQDQLDVVNAESKKYKYDYIISNPDIFSYSMLLKDLLYPRTVLEQLEDQQIAAYRILENKYPDHVYTTIAGGIVNARENLKPGGQYVDITAPDLSGVQHTISEEIKGKVAIIDFWASWCGPCRINSKKVIPLYERYKDKGFTVVGIARENNDADAMKKAIETDGYQWLNLVELDDSGMIWHKYGMSNAAGRVFLVDKEGTIIYIDPTAEQIEEYLSANL